VSTIRGAGAASAVASVCDGKAAEHGIRDRMLGLPPELKPTSMLTWQGVADVTEALRMPQDGLLVDLARRGPVRRSSARRAAGVPSSARSWCATGSELLGGGRPGGRAGVGPHPRGEPSAGPVGGWLRRRPGAREARVARGRAEGVAGGARGAGRRRRGAPGPAGRGPTLAGLVRLAAPRIRDRHRTLSRARFPQVGAGPGTWPAALTRCVTC
jgi:hypothetical protein